MKKPTAKWQLILQWICAGCWLVVVILDLIFGQKLSIMILNVAAGLCFLLSAISFTRRYREEHHD